MSDLVRHTDRLLSALAAARDAFDAGDALSATAALDDVVASCAELERAGARLDRGTLQDAIELHRACAEAALTAQVTLNEKLEQAAGARRATRAYAG